MTNRLLLSAVAMMMIGCGGADGEAMNDSTDLAMTDSMPMTSDPQATAVMRDSAGNDIGTLRLSDESGNIRVQGDLHGLSAGTHGIHIHEIGACAPGFDAAGSHWNPTNAQHGRDNAEGPHLGDLPNITASADGAVTVDVRTSGGSLHGDPMALDADGASLVIHADADDYATDPDGESGAKIACGVIAMP